MPIGLKTNSGPDMFRKAKSSLRNSSSKSTAPAWATALISALSLSAAILAAADFSPFDLLSPAPQKAIARPTRAARKTPLWLRAQIFQKAPYCPSAEAWAAGQPLPPR